MGRLNLNQPIARLNNGSDMPLLGLGAYNMHGKEAENAVAHALEIGYRLIDTAEMYGNELEVGKAIRTSGIDRSEIFLTTKVNNRDQGYDSTLRAFEVSLQKLDCEYIDLYMVHWPIRGKRKATWKALENIYTEGRVKAIGVANYLVPFLRELKDYASIVPAVNQVEFSPFLYLKELVDYCHSNQIQAQAYSPLVRGKKMKDPVLTKLANKYHKTPAQVILRWDIQLGVSAIPKSASPARLKENFQIFDFNLSDEDMASIGGLNENLRVVDDPMVYF
ncbi:MAG: aldo/keto reductase [Bacteroidetes bacterium]|nr:MAG: aldo/keto reductase [Bacteroidota bacterium]